MNKSELIIKVNSGEKVIFKDLPEDLRSDRDVFELLLNDNIYAYKYAIGENILKDEYLITTAVKLNWHNYKLIPDDIKNNKSLSLNLVKINPKIYGYLPDSLKVDNDLFKEVLQTEALSGEDLLKIIKDNKNLQDDEEVLLLSAKKGLSLFYFSNELKSDANVLEKIYDINPHSIEYFDKKLINDKRFVDMWKKKSIENILYFDYMEEYYQEYIDLVISKPSLWFYFPVETKKNTKLVIDIIKSHSERGVFDLELFIKEVKKDFPKEKSVWMALTMSKKIPLHFVSLLPDEFHSDKDILTVYLYSFQNTLKRKYSDKMLQAIGADKKLAFILAKTNDFKMSYLIDELKYSVDFAKKLLNIKPEYFKGLPDEIKEHEDILPIIYENVDFFQYLPLSKKRDLKFVINLVKKDIEFYKFVEDEVKFTREFLLEFRDYIEESHNMLRILNKPNDVIEEYEELQKIIREEELKEKFDNQKINKTIMNRKKV